MLAALFWISVSILGRPYFYPEKYRSDAEMSEESEADSIVLCMDMKKM